MSGLDAIVALKTTSNFEFEATVPEGWGQGRAAYGGIPGALTLEAARLAYARPVRSLSLNFVGPVEPGKLRITHRKLREGKSATHCAIELSQNDSIVAASLLVLGEGRETAVEFEGRPAPRLVAPYDATPFPFIPGVTPEFTNHFEYRWTSPSFPFSGGEPKVQGWVRPKDGTTSGPAMVAALLDAWPPPVWNLVEVPSPGSSVSWYISFQPAAHRTDIGEGAWWSYDASLQSSHDGYAHFEGNLWNSFGEHVAISRQVFAEFSRRT